MTRASSVIARAAHRRHWTFQASVRDDCPIKFCVILRTSCFLQLPAGCLDTLLIADLEKGLHVS